MDATEKRLALFQEKFDASKFFNSDVSAIESTIYTAPLIYKYFSIERRHFFTKPQVRFSQNEVLNDPFESSVRWKSVGLDVLRDHVIEVANYVIPKLFSDPDYLVEAAMDEIASKGITLNRQQRKFVEDQIRSEESRTRIANEMPATKALIETMTRRVFSQMTTEFETITANALARSGVLSLTEQPLNREMWSRYGGDGSGFVIGFDAQHPFFFRERDGIPTNALKKVIYSDEWPDAFTKNPYYLFLVKSPAWAGEQEWRIFQEFIKCDESIGTDKTAVHLANLPADLIKSVHFGMAYRDADVKEDVAKLVKFGCTPDLYRINVDALSGVLDSKPV